MQDIESESVINFLRKQNEELKETIQKLDINIQLLGSSAAFILEKVEKLKSHLELPDSKDAFKEFVQGNPELAIQWIAGIEKRELVTIIIDRLTAIKDQTDKLKVKA